MAQVYCERCDQLDQYLIGKSDPMSDSAKSTRMEKALKQIEVDESNAQGSG